MTALPPRQLRAPLVDAMPPFLVSDEVEAVARTVIRRHDTALGWIPRQVRVVYLLKLGDKPATDDTIDTVAKCNLAPALWRVLSDRRGSEEPVDFAIWVKECYWRLFGPHQQEAVVAHELSHVDVDDKGKPRIRKHDVEEFGQIAAWYGPWDGGLTMLERQLQAWRADETNAPAAAEAKSSKVRPIR